jgi:DNA modification methylase
MADRSPRRSGSEFKSRAEIVDYASRTLFTTDARFRIYFRCIDELPWVVSRRVSLLLSWPILDVQEQGVCELGDRKTAGHAAAVALLKRIERGEVGQERDQARIHPFPARMPVSLAAAIIESLSKLGDVVLDPMCGSGTTLIAAKRTGRYAIGVDRDPMALLVSQVSVCDRWPADVSAAGQRISDRAKQMLGSRSGRQPTDGELKQFLSYWFPRASVKELSALCVAMEEEERITRQLAEVAFSSLIIAKSAGVSYAMDIARSRPHKVADREIASPFSLWEKRFAAVVARRPFVERTGKDAVVVEGDARQMPLATGKVDLVLTSPPYLNAIDYLRGHKFSLVWLGHELRGLRELRGELVGSERGLWTRDGLPPELELRLKRRLDSPREQALVRRYMSDLGHSLAEVSRVLRSGGLAVMVVGPTIMNARRSDAAEVVKALAMQHGLHPVGHAFRNLPAGWRSLPPPGKLRRSNPAAARMRREAVVILQKP